MLNRKNSTVGILAVLAALTLTGHARAANITYVGAVIDDASSQATDYYSTNVAKSLDADGDNRYGTDGHDLFFVDTSQPAYIAFASIGTGIGGAAPNVLYTAVDDPDAAAPHDPKINLNTTTGGLGASTKSAVITYVITDASLVPNGFRLGVITDGLDGDQFSSVELYVEQTAGSGSGAAQVDTAPFVNSTLDMFFFDLTNLQTGDQFTLYVDTPAGGNFATLQGVVYDSIPTPAALPAGLAMLGVIATRRRR